MKRNTNGFRIGSAWDTWHKAGFDYALAHTPNSEAIARAALDYFAQSGFAGCNAQSAISRAFAQGATQSMGSAQ